MKIIEEDSEYEVIDELQGDQFLEPPLDFISNHPLEYLRNPYHSSPGMPNIPRGYHTLHADYIPWNPMGPQRIVRKITGAMALNRESLKNVIASTELVMVYFYKTRDRICQCATPLFDETAEAVRSKFPDAHLVVLGKVDCGVEGNDYEDFSVRSYPTIKIFRNGEPHMGKYEGAYLPKQLEEFITKELVCPITRVLEPNELANTNNGRKTIIAHFEREDMTEYDMFRRIAHGLKKFGDFRVRFGKDNLNQLCFESVISFIPGIESPYESKERFLLSGTCYNELDTWAHRKLMVQEMVPENFAQLTQSPYPIFILYYSPNDTSIVHKFKEIVGNNLLKRKHNVNFVVANGVKFTNAMRKHGKGESDLPVIAIETTRRNHVFPHPFNHTISKTLLEFFKDFDIGKLDYFARGGDSWSDLRASLENPRERFRYVF